MNQLTRMEYTPGIDRIILDMFDDGKSDEEIARTFCGAGFHATGSAIKTRRLKLGLKRESAPAKSGIAIPERPIAETITLRLDPMILQDVTLKARKAGVERNKFIRLLFYKYWDAERAA